MMIRLLTAIAIVFCLIGCESEKGSDGVVDLPIEKIGFEGDPKAKKKSIALLDKVLREQGDLGVYGDLSGGLEELIRDFAVEITEREDHYEIDIYPRSSEGGHDFSFTINKETGKRSEVAVGEVLPEPEFDQ